MYKRQGFTLVELIVVMSVLAILGTISFITFTSYVTDSRDSKRIVDLESISSALEIRYKRSGNIYPKPSDSVITSYTDTDGATTKRFGFLGYIKSDLNLDFNTLPIDPATGDSYVYATTVDSKYFELAATLEQPDRTKNDTAFHLVDQGYASPTDDYAYILGNYKQDASIGHYPKHLVFLKDTGGHKKIPREDLTIGSLQLVGGNPVFNPSTGITMIVNGGTDVPYPIKSKNFASSATDTGSTDFYLEATGTVVNCPKCSN